MFSDKILFGFKAKSKKSYCQKLEREEWLKFTSPMDLNDTEFTSLFREYFFAHLDILNPNARIGTHFCSTWCSRGRGEFS